jgi:hypothetical protein
MDIKLSQGEAFNVKNSSGKNVLSVGNSSTDTVQEKLVSGTNIKTVNGASILGSGNLDAQDVFWAEYGVTSFDDMKAAHDAGKEVKMEYGASIYTHHIYTLDGITISPLNNYHHASFLSHNARTIDDGPCYFYEIELSGYGDALTWSYKHKPLGRLDFIELGNEQLIPGANDVFVKIPLASNTEIDALFDGGGGGGSGSGSGSGN